MSALLCGCNSPKEDQSGGDAAVDEKANAARLERARNTKIIEDCKKAISVKPNYGKSHFNMGNVYGPMPRPQIQLAQRVA